MNGMRVYNPPPVNGGFNQSGAKLRIDAGYYPNDDYVNQKPDFASHNGPLSPAPMQLNGNYSQVNPNASANFSLNPNVNVNANAGFNPRQREELDDDVMSGTDDRAQNGGMTRSDRFGTTLFEPGRDNDGEQQFDDPFDLPNPNDAALPNGAYDSNPYGGYEQMLNVQPPHAAPFTPRPNQLQVAVGDDRPFSPQNGAVPGAFSPNNGLAHGPFSPNSAPARPFSPNNGVAAASFSPNNGPAPGPFSPGAQTGFGQPRPAPPSRPFSPAGRSAIVATVNRPQLVQPNPAPAPPSGPPNATLRSGPPGDKTVQLADAIELLASNNDAVRSHAAAYIQHLLYRDEDAKARCRLLNGIPQLVRLIANSRLETARAGLGVLLNVSTGRNNDENKHTIVTAGGIEVFVTMLTTPQDSADIHELVTGILWNVATCRDTRRVLLDRAAQPLVDCVIKPHAERAFQLLQQVRVLATELQQNGHSPAATNLPGDLAQRMYEVRVANQQTWSTVLRNATGALRCLSADGEVARRRLRETRFLVSSLLVFVRLAIETREFASDRDNKIIENTISILRNISFALQELADPTYTKRRRDEETQLVATTSRRSDVPAPGTPNDHEKVTCFRASKKSADTSARPTNVVPPPSISANDDLALLWSPETVRLYQTILAECCNPQTIEAAAGTLQNLTACEWQPAIDIRAQLRKEKALPILVDLLNLNTDSIVLATVLCIRNLIIDQRNKDLIGRNALPQLGSKLPLDERDVQVDARGSRYCTVNDLSQPTLAAILATIHELVAKPSKQELAEAERLRKKLEQQNARRRTTNTNTNTNNQPAPNSAEEEQLSAAIKQANTAFARMLLDNNCVQRLFFIVRSAPSDQDNSSTLRLRFDPKVVRFAQAVLYQLWMYTELRPEYLRRGWLERDFLPTSVTNQAPSTAAPSASGPQQPVRSSQPVQPAGNAQLQANTNTASRTTMDPNASRSQPSTLALTVRSQPPTQSAPLPPGPRAQQAPTMSRIGSPPPPNNGPYAYTNTTRSGMPPPRSVAGTMQPGAGFGISLGGPGAGMAANSNDRQALLNASSMQLGGSQPSFSNNGIQRSTDNIDLNATYTADVRVPPAAGGPAGGPTGRPSTMPRPGGNLSTVPREIMLSQGALGPQQFGEPMYTRVDRIGDGRPYDPRSAANTLGRDQGQGPYSSTIQLVPSRSAITGPAEDPVADSWV